MIKELLSKSEIAREKNDRLFLCDACAKGWLSAIEATYTLLHFSLRDNLYIECYYERALHFDNIWGIVEGVTYPYLQWQFADINCTCGDICVSETGWQRDKSKFIASNTPIPHAIDNATVGETICVKDCTYNENVDVTKSNLTIRFYLR